MREPQIAIVGAGAAGIGAGLALRRLGVPFVILEAKIRTGGRAYTDQDSLGIAWDQGCHWFHSADRNILAEIAKKLGHDYAADKFESDFPIFMNGEWLDADARLACDDAILAAFDAIYAAGVAGRDEACESVIEYVEPWGPLIRHWLQMMSSADPEIFSVSDYARYEDSDINGATREGYGQLFSTLVQTVPVKLACPVRAITQLSGKCTLLTDDGNLNVDAVIVTASTNVLIDDVIRFDPALPDEFRAALRDVPCGYYEKVGIAFDGDVFSGLIKSGDAELCDPAGSHPMYFEVAPHGQHIAIGHVAGSYAKELADMGKQALEEFTIEKLVTTFGSKLRKRIIGAEASQWSHDPWIRGAFCYVRAGAGTARETFISADLAPVFFAGEALHTPFNGTAHGAYLSGLDTAHRVASFLGHEVMEADPLWLPDGLSTA